MKRFIAFILTMLLLTVPLTASAKGDINEIASFNTYKNANTVLPYRLIKPTKFIAFKGRERKQKASARNYTAYIHFQAFIRRMQKRVFADLQEEKDYAKS